jgi:hypothetical protein
MAIRPGRKLAQGTAAGSKILSCSQRLTKDRLAARCLAQTRWIEAQKYNLKMPNSIHATGTL